MSNGRMNAANPAHVAHSGDVDDRERKESDYALGKVLDTYEGRRTVWQLLSLCGVFHTVMSGEANLVFYNAGKQDIGHRLQAWCLEVAPESYDKMGREARSRASAQQAVTKAVLASAPGDREELGYDHSSD